MEDKTVRGISFAGMLTVAFVALKLCGVITWSWWWVASPLWIRLILDVVGYVVISLIIKADEERWFR